MNDTIQLTTANNATFKIHWIGVANVDGVLRFAIQAGADLGAIFQTFSNPANCETLTRVNDGIETEFTGYTVFRGIQINYNGEIIVALSKI